MIIPWPELSVDGGYAGIVSHIIRDVDLLESMRPYEGRGRDENVRLLEI